MKQDNIIVGTFRVVIGVFVAMAYGAVVAQEIISLST